MNLQLLIFWPFQGPRPQRKSAISRHLVLNTHRAKNALRVRPCHALSHLVPIGLYWIELLFLLSTIRCEHVSVCSIACSLAKLRLGCPFVEPYLGVYQVPHKQRCSSLQKRNHVKKPRCTPTALQTCCFWFCMPKPLTARLASSPVLVPPSR